MQNIVDNPLGGSKLGFLFDFNKLLELKPEVKFSDNRVLIMELSGGDQHSTKRLSKGWNRQLYLKRFNLEQYQNESFKVAEKDNNPYERPEYLSGYMWRRKRIPNYQNSLPIIQTFYLVNIDPSSLLGSEVLTQVVPITVWEDSPFKQIYRSFSHVFDGDEIELMISRPSQEQYIKQLDSPRKKLLLEWGNNPKIKELAEEITAVYPSTLYKTLAIEQYLRDNYFYSLRPGLPDDPKTSQLEYFLFESKKGYCTYSAFAMTQMLRSIGIASRVAVGFAPDMRNSTLNFYDIREVDSHAWVEVFLDEYGWITFDPTSANIAPDEEYEFSLSNKEERDDLIEQILKNKDLMEEIRKQKEESQDLFKDIYSQLKRSIRWLALLIFSIILLLILCLFYLRKNIALIKYQFSQDIRKQCIHLYHAILTRLLSYGISLNQGESIEEFSNRLLTDYAIDIHQITSLYQASQFQQVQAPECRANDLKKLYQQFNDTLKKQPLLKKIKASFNFSIFWKKILPVFLLLFLPFFYYSGNAEASLDSYIKQAKTAISNSYFDQALKLLNEAEKAYPESYEPNYEKGKLYYEHDLYESAVKEFQFTQAKYDFSNIGTGLNIYSYLASSFGKLGKDNEAVKVYEQSFRYHENEDAYDNLGWMYYKVHQNTKGIDFVQQGLKKYPDSPDLLMTLGTLYSSAYEYKLSKQSYLQSIDKSKGTKNSNFRAIAYYNLSLLEDTFLYYDYAYQTALASLSIKDRSSAHLELSYLYKNAMELKQAFEEVTRANSMEPETLFPELSMVNLFILSGNLDKAIEMAHQLLESVDYSWMLYFGTSISEFHNKIYLYLTKAYRYKGKQLKYTLPDKLQNHLFRPFYQLYYGVKSLYYQFCYFNNSLKIAEEKINGGSELEGLKLLSSALSNIWPAKARKILTLAQNIEIKINPAKKRIYDMKLILLEDQLFINKQKQIAKIKKTMNQLDQRWEKDLLVDGQLELMKHARGMERTGYLIELFIDYPQFIPMFGYSLPVQIEFDASLSKKQCKELTKILHQRGMRNNQQSPLQLYINISNNQYHLLFTYKNRTIKKYSVKAKTNEDFNDKIFEEIFVFKL
ncbi:MAG: hypothetical protein MJB14_05535 [Spirochaetes bacterium]|nr:hypothetical protein [Spirochaetota bacterium]